MREWQSLLQVLHVYAVCWTELTQSFLRACLSVRLYDYSFIMCLRQLQIKAGVHLKAVCQCLVHVSSNAKFFCLRRLQFCANFWVIFGHFGKEPFFLKE